MGQEREDYGDPDGPRVPSLRTLAIVLSLIAIGVTAVVAPFALLYWLVSGFAAMN
jgi:hypothetical protein